MTPEQEALLIATARAVRRLAYLKGVAGDGVSEDVVEAMDEALAPFSIGPAREVDLPPAWD